MLFVLYASSTETFDHFLASFSLLTTFSPPSRADETRARFSTRLRVLRLGDHAVLPPSMRFSFRLEEYSTRGVLSEVLSVVLSEVLKREIFRKKRPSKNAPWLSIISHQPKRL
jgi:hypothetical protein